MSWSYKLTKLLLYSWARRLNDYAKTSPMQKCRRCDGVLLQDVLEEVGVPLQALHCIVCGEWVDPLILYHRKLAVLPEPSRARTTTFDASATGRLLGRRRAE